MSGASQRDVLDQLVVRVPSLATVLSRAARRVPTGSRFRRRVVEFQVKRAFAAMARSDVDLVVLLFEPAAEVEMQGMAAVGVDERYHGHDGIRALYANIDEVFDEWSWTIREIVDGGDRLAVHTDFFGHGRASGVVTEIRGGGTAVRVSDSGRATWQGWYVEQGGWEKALAAVGLSAPVT